MTVRPGKIHDLSANPASGGKKFLVQMRSRVGMTKCSLGTSFLVPAKGQVWGKRSVQGSCWVRAEEALRALSEVSGS